MSAKRLLFSKRGEPIRYGPYRLRYLPGTRPVRLKYLQSRDIIARMDALQIKFFLEHVKKKDFVVDVGGNLGQYTVLFSYLAGLTGQVITFEPDANHRRILENNLRLNGLTDRVIVEDSALSDCNGTHAFFSRNDAMSSLVKSGLGSNSSSPDVKERVIKTVRLDDYLETRNLRPPDWVKVDTEGAEVLVLKGAQAMMRSKSTTIVCELHPYAWEEFGTTFEELMDLVSDCGRSIDYLEPPRRAPGTTYGVVIIR
jgi:FkbM family methyltransferase